VIVASDAKASLRILSNMKWLLSADCHLIAEDFTEVCGVYQREELAPLGGPAQFIAYAAGASDGNTIRKWLYSERERAGLKGDDLEAAVNEAGGKGNMRRHVCAPVAD
jgi:hypothetical protein